MGKKNIFLLLLILGTAFWGISFSITKIAIGYTSSSVFLFYRFLIATLVLSAIFFKYIKQMTWQTAKTGAILAIPLCFGIYLQTFGIKYSSASQCSFVAGVTVIIIPLLKMLFYKSIAPKKIWWAAIIAFIGLAIISVNQNFSIGIGDLYTIIGALGFAIYLVEVEKYSKLGKIIYSIVPMFATCTIIAFLLALVDGQANWIPVHTEFWIGAFYCALFSTAYMYTISNLSQRYLSAEKVAIIYLFEPIFGAIAAHFILGENLTWRLLLGGSLIFAATLLSELKFSRNAESKPCLN